MYYPYTTGKPNDFPYINISIRKTGILTICLPTNCPLIHFLYSTLFSHPRITSIFRYYAYNCQGKIFFLKYNRKIMELGRK